jgi:opacity protein-like surface antigen
MRQTSRIKKAHTARTRVLLRLGALTVAALALCSSLAEAQRHHPGYSSGYSSGSLRLKIGMLEPDGESEFWDTQFQDFTGAVSDLDDIVLGVDYLWPLGRSTSLAFGVSFWEGETTQAYRDYTDSIGSSIRHTTTLQATDVTVALIYRFGHRDSTLAPYIGAGGGFVWWRLEETGDFIDFASSELPIVFAHYQAEGTTSEVFAVAGLEMALTPSWSFLVEGRWRRADDELGDDYGGFGEIDLSGTELTAGFALRF